MNKSFLVFIVFVCLLAFDLLIAARIHGCRMQMHARPGQSASLENEVQWMTRILTVTNLPGALCFHVEDYLKDKLEVDFLETNMWRETLRPIYYLLIVGFESWLYAVGIRWVIGRRRSKP
ncbi:MAG: hypothetical protein HZA88_10750 [Verrucomicrobia bacterium]|nr:hypothetical protein [Verrucomicrobiota bacterium]